MSNYPPPGPPPPPYGYTPAPGITFVPAPVMMPVYPPHLPPPTDQTQPTFVTNHYYPSQPQVIGHPPHVVTPVEVDVDWVSTTPTGAASYTHKALVAGKEGWDGSPLWVIRAHHSGEFIPGKLAIKHKAAYVPHDGREVPVHNFDVLLAKGNTVRWVTSSYGQVPPGAIPAGNTHTGEPLYIARVSHMNSITPGKVHPSHRCAYICFGGEEISFKTYEVLCRIVG